MSPHISYHPLGTATIRRYVSYMSSQDPAGLAGVHYDGAGAHDRFRSAFVEMAGAAPTLSGVFDTCHGLNLAIMQGFFGRFHYVHQARLSAMSALLQPYSHSWQGLLPTWPATDSAVDQLGDVPSSGVFIAAEQLAQFMNDAHHEPQLRAALAQEFPGEKLQVLWLALTDAHECGFGLLEASGVFEPDPNDIARSRCRTNQTNCDPAGLRLFLAPPPAPSAAEPAPPADASAEFLPPPPRPSNAVAQLPPPPPPPPPPPDAAAELPPPPAPTEPAGSMPDPAPAAGTAEVQRKMPGAPSLAQRMRERANDLDPPSDT